jgi:hypothetical protein
MGDDCPDRGMEPGWVCLRPEWRQSLDGLASARNGDRASMGLRPPGIGSEPGLLTPLEKSTSDD